MPLCVELCAALGVFAAACGLVAEVAPLLAAGFADVAGFAAGVELSPEGGAFAAGVVDGVVAGVCCAAAVPARMRVAANRLIAMLGSFRMDLVSQSFGACANGRNRDVGSVTLACHLRGLARTGAPLRG